MNNPFRLSFIPKDETYIDEKGRHCIDIDIVGTIVKYEIIGLNPKGIKGYNLKEIKDGE